VSSADVDEFRRAIDPLASAGKLVILVKFPASFKHDAAGRPPRLADVAMRDPGRRRAAP
jgi:hypothetical protein